MKKILLVFVSLMVTATMFAQKDVTQFLGISIDGTKSAMIQKLKEKGFQYDSRYDWLEGEFNGHNVYVSIATNNNKVWRLVVQDAVSQSENNIKIRYNTLSRQFLDNKKYVVASVSQEDYFLSDDEDISYEIAVHDKQYQATFYQIPTDTASMAEYAQQKILSTYTEEQIRGLTEEEKRSAILEMALEILSKKMVWFTIRKDHIGSGYFIVMFYDNEYNHSNGEDL